VRMYLDVAERFSDLSAGEVALFAAARLQANRGVSAEARRLLHRYLKRYPEGRFARDAADRLRILDEPAP
jgi:outer membrane protein assembly factor BamD (BamD/ComL family)